MDHVVEGAAIGFIEEELADERKEEEEITESCKPIDLDADFSKQENKDVKEEQEEIVDAKARKAGGVGDERPAGAVSLRAGKKSKLPKFEQWIKDIISGKKELDDEL